MNRNDYFHRRNVLWQESLVFVSIEEDYVDISGNRHVTIEAKRSFSVPLVEM